MNRFKQLAALSCLFLFVGALQAQKDITLEDIWQRYTFMPRSVPGFNFQNDGQHYTRLEDNKVVQYDLTTGRQTAVLFDAAAFSGTNGFEGDFDGYTFSKDESKMLIKTNTESIYRRSSKANFFVFDQKNNQLNPLFAEGKQMYATFNPQADQVAFVFDNNMYVKKLSDGTITQITEDGKYNHIINGGTDWVYEEEFGFAQGFQWSADGKKIAFYRFDESEVEEFTMTNYRNGLYPEYVTFKYPKVGETNSTVSIHIFHTDTEQKVNVDVGEEADQYIPRIKWTQDADLLCVYRLNRHQNFIEYLLADAQNGTTKTLYSEKNDYYIAESTFDNTRFLKNGKQVIISSEKDGWHHLYLYDMDGSLVRQLTKGEWEVTAFYGLDEANSVLFYQAAKEQPMQREIYSLSLDGNEGRIMTNQQGWNSAQFSSTFDYYVLTHSTANSPAVYTVYRRDGQPVRVIEDNARLKRTQNGYKTSPVEFFSFETKDKVELNGWMIKPKNFNPGVQYPVFMYLYGGPGSQQVTDSWKGQNYWWFQMLAQQGFIVACVDNRGTGARGEEFKKMTYQQLGKYETIDQIEAARYLGELPYTNANRIGIFGWSYGGYMSTSCLLKGNDVFSLAIAVAPVTNWKWYDTIYTERFMRSEKENEEGYRDNSPVNFADRLKGHYLLVHGMGDDNVHFQHTAEMANALIAANKQFDTYFYPNRNHGIYGGTTRLHLYQKMTDFLMERLHTKAPARFDKRPKGLEYDKKEKVRMKN